ncbi:nucleotidyltransferase family protein [Thermomonas paludicola]|uniref:nucleotidyltransferase family protein n=1 Tax=Thermomonas paludicola TaxID=2884874 RepID=UPI002114FD08|nr:nucleotidyltransferase family protein [Thermomonas paludicola]
MSSVQPTLADPTVRWCADALAGEALERLAEAIPGTVDGLLQCAEKEGVTALLAQCLAMDATLQPAALVPVTAALRGHAKALSMLELSRRARARHVLGVLQEADIPVLVLKGMALGYWLYPSPVQRPGVDVDLLLPDVAAAEVAVAALLANGYRLADGVWPAQSSGFEATLHFASRHDHEVDLHWRLLNHARLAQGFEFSELLATAVPLPALATGACGLGRVHALAHALLHRVANASSGRQNRLIWLYDIHLLARACVAADWRAFLELCKQKAITQPCLDGLAACHAVLHTPLPEDLLATLHQQGEAEHWHIGALSQRGALDRAHWAALRWQQRLPWMWRKLLPPPSFMRYRYGVQGWLGLMIAYARRLWVGACRALGG